MKSILIVDDNQSIRELAELSLSVLGDYEVTVATDGVEAQDVMREHAFDAVITDLDMPRMTGTELLQWIRTESPSPDCPVAILTAVGDSKRREELLAAGANAYLEKPFQPDQLDGVLREMLGD
jgi:two-component system chemotaxis response regulator CheY